MHKHVDKVAHLLMQHGPIDFIVISRDLKPVNSVDSAESTTNCAHKSNIKDDANISERILWDTRQCAMKREKSLLPFSVSNDVYF